MSGHGPRMLCALLAAATLLACGAADEGVPEQSPAPAPQAGAGLSPEQVSALAPLTLRDLERIQRLSPLPPPPPDPTNRVADDAAAAILGQFLFFDQRLSRNGSISCSTCHDPARGFSDGLSLPNTLGLGARHTPGILNVAQGRWFFWDGRADSLWSQALGPLENPVEMGFSRLELLHLFAADPDLRTAYNTLFGALPPTQDAQRFPQVARPDPGQPDSAHHLAWIAMAAADRHAVNVFYSNAGKAIAAYERKLHSADAPFDRFVAGVRSGDQEQLAALDDAQRRGLALFMNRGRCTLCHLGPAFSDSEFHNTSAPPLGGGELRDTGRYGGIPLLQSDPFNAAGLYSDERAGTAAQRVQRVLPSSETWGEFKTPTLRDVARRPPYMHQGQFADLAAVIEFYSSLEGAAGRNHHAEQILVPLLLSAQEKAELQAFLESLNGRLPPQNLMRQPASPLGAN